MLFQGFVWAPLATGSDGKTLVGLLASGSCQELETELVNVTGKVKYP